MPSRSLTTANLRDLKLDRRGRYGVGRKIGDGAQGTVYRVLDNTTGEDGWWAAKVTPHPKVTTTRRSTNEINSRHLNHERLMYENSLVKLRGRVIPQIPDGKTLYVYKQDREGTFACARRVC